MKKKICYACITLLFVIGNSCEKDDSIDEPNRLSISKITVNESDKKATFSATLKNGIKGGLIVEFETKDGSATSPSDYISKNGTIEFAGKAGEVKSLTIDITDDLILEPTEVFNIIITNLTSGFETAKKEIDIEIIDDETPSENSGVSINDVTVNENDGTMDFTVTLSDAVQGGFTVDYVTNDDSANNADYISARGSLKFEGTANEAQTISIEIINDAIIEPIENFTVSLSEISTSLVSIKDETGVGTIEDDDISNSEIGLSINDITVNESDGIAVFTVSLTGAVQEPFTVNFSTIEGSASSLSDYTTIEGTLNFIGTEGETQIISVDILGDDIIEPNELFTVSISDVSTNLIGIKDEVGEVTIRDDDAVQGETGLFIDDISINEDEGNATFTVTLVGQLQEGLTVDYATNASSATATSDYTNKNGTLTFAGNNNETQKVLVDIVDDEIIETNEEFKVILSNNTSSLVAILKDVGIGTIKDDDIKPGISGVEIDDVAVNEDAGKALFTITLKDDFQDGFTVDYKTVDNSATSPDDFISKNGVLTFSGESGETQTISIDIINDGSPDSNETFEVHLTNAEPNIVPILKSVGTGTITDNDPIEPIYLSIDDLEVNEADGLATFSVILSDKVQGGLTVDYTTSDVTAISSIDYTSSNGTLTFTGVANEKELITVNITDDYINEQNETFEIILSDISSDLVTFLDDRAIVTIQDDDDMIDISSCLLAYYPFSGSANDESGNGHHGSVFGNVKLTTDRFGTNDSAFEFDGIDDYINTFSKFDIESRTVSLWINSYEIIGSGGEPESPRSHMVITQDSNDELDYGILRVDIDNGNMKLWAGGSIGTYTRSININTWYHLVLVLDGDVTRYYVNGELVGQGTSNDVASTFNPNPEFIIGAGRSKTNQFFEGKIDDIRVYCRALNTEQILALYNE